MRCLTLAPCLHLGYVAICLLSLSIGGFNWQGQLGSRSPTQSGDFFFLFETATQSADISYEASSYIYIGWLSKTFANMRQKLVLEC